MNRVLSRDLFIGVIFLIIQLTLFRHLSIFGATADLILLYLLWVGANNASRIYTMIFAAGLGLIQDAFLDIWGINMFAKIFVVLASFGFLQNMTENKPFISQVAGAILVCSLIHNLTYLGIASVASDYNIAINFWEIAIGNSLYTAFTGATLYLFKKED